MSSASVPPTTATQPPNATALPDGAAPQSTLPYPPIHTDAKFVILSDWDGTVTRSDSNDFLTDNFGFGYEKRRQGNRDTLTGTKTFRDSFREMLESVTISFEECKQKLKENMKVDPGFTDFYKWTVDNGLPFVIVSSGMAPLIRATLSAFIGVDASEKIEIIANDVTFTPDDGRWHIQYRHPESGYGHDKSRAILPYRALPDRPVIFFFGDGVSDMSAARHADVLFVKQKEDGENDLATYCTNEGIRHILFTDFSNALPVVEAIVQGKYTVEEVLTAGGLPAPAPLA